MKTAFRRASTEMLRMLLKTSDSEEVMSKAVIELTRRGETVKECPQCGGVLCYYYTYRKNSVGLDKAIYCPECCYTVEGVF